MTKVVAGSASVGLGREPAKALSEEFVETLYEKHPGGSSQESAAHAGASNRYIPADSVRPLKGEWGLRELSIEGFDTDIARRVSAGAHAGKYQRLPHAGPPRRLSAAIHAAFLIVALGLATSGALAAPDSVSLTVSTAPVNLGDPFKARGLGDVLSVTVNVVASAAGAAVVDLGEGVVYLGDFADSDGDGLVDEDAANLVDQDLGFLRVQGAVVPVAGAVGMSETANSISVPVATGTTAISFQVQIVGTASPLQGSWSFSGGDQVTRELNVQLVSGGGGIGTTSSVGNVVATTTTAISTQGFNGFGKHVWFVAEDGEHLVGLDPNDGQPYPAGVYLKWHVLLAVNNYYSYAWEDAWVTDDFGEEFGVQCDGVDANHPAEFDVDEGPGECAIVPFNIFGIDVSSWGGVVGLTASGPSSAVSLAWTDIDAPAFAGNWWETWAGIEFLVFTDVNPDGEQEFTSTDCVDLNLGSVLSFQDPYTHNILTAGTGDIEICAEQRAACVETVNPHGQTVPPAGHTTLPGPKGGQNEDGFYEFVGGPQGAVFFVNGFGPYLPGTVLKITESPGIDPPGKEKSIGSSNGQAGAVTAHLILPSDPVVSVYVGGALVDTFTCYVPPPPK